MNEEVERESKGRRRGELKEWELEFVIVLIVRLLGLPVSLFVSRWPMELWID